MNKTLLKMRPLVTVAVVTRDRREDLRRCLHSVYDQTYDPLEVVVVDHASSDGTPEMVASEFPEVRLLRQTTNLGCPGGRNVAAQEAQGPYVFFLDDDATLEPQAVEAAVNFLAPRPRFAALGIAVVPHPETPQVTCAFDPARLGHRPRLYPHFSGGAALVRRDVFIDLGGFRSDFLYGGEERELSLRFLRAGYFIAYLPTVKMFHRRTPGGQRDERARLRTGLRNDLLFIWTYMPLPLAFAATANKLLYYAKFARSKGNLRALLPDLFRAPLVSLRFALSAQRRPVSFAFFAALKALERVHIDPDDERWHRRLRRLSDQGRRRKQWVG